MSKTIQTPRYFVKRQNRCVRIICKGYGTVMLYTDRDWDLDDAERDARKECKKLNAMPPEPTP